MPTFVLLDYVMGDFSSGKVELGDLQKSLQLGSDVQHDVGVGDAFLLGSSGFPIQWLDLVGENRAIDTVYLRDNSNGCSLILVEIGQ